MVTHKHNHTASEEFIWAVSSQSERQIGEHYYWDVGLGCFHRLVQVCPPLFPELAGMVWTYDPFFLQGMLC